MKRVSGNLVSNIYLLLILWHSFIFFRSLLYSLSLSLAFPCFARTTVFFSCRAEKERDEKEREVMEPYKK